MRNSRAFTPDVTESLETRSVPSLGLSGAHALVNGLAVTRGDVSAPFHMPPGTFVQGSVPGVSTAGGSLFTLRSGPTTTTVAPAASAPIGTTTTTAAPAATTPAATTTTTTSTPAHHPAGTFFQGNLPGVSTAGGSLFTLRSFHRA